MKTYFNRETAQTFALAFLVGALLLALSYGADRAGALVGKSWTFEREAAGVFDVKIVLLLLAAFFLAIIFRVFLGNAASGVIKQFALLVWANLAFVAGALMAAGVLAHFETGDWTGAIAAVATLAALLGIAGIGLLLSLGLKDRSFSIKAISALGLVALALLLIPAHTMT